ncbi:MAG: AMP-binding protein, partial [Actinomycetota bacterium]|nr:AMP-binding protein [Actinomycetota bacterium]
LEVLDDRWPQERPVPGLPRWPQARAMHYTSGTTGRSKGVYSGMLGVAGGHALCEDERTVWGFRPDDVHLVASALYHSGPHRFAANTLLYGGRVVVLPRFDAGAALAAIARERVTTTFVVPTHLARMLDHPDFAATDLSSLRWVAHAGAPCPEPLKRRIVDAFPPGVVWEFYGSTEGQFTAIGPDEWRRRPGSVGRARAGRELLVVDDGGRRLPAGEVGDVYCTPRPSHASPTGAPRTRPLPRGGATRSPSATSAASTTTATCGSRGAAATSSSAGVSTSTRPRSSASSPPARG